MKTEEDFFPLNSQELDFVAKHFREIDEILEGKLTANNTVRELTKRLDETATAEAEALFIDLAKLIDQSVRGIARITWRRFSSSEWELFGDLHGPKGPKKSLALVGISLNCLSPRPPALVGWAHLLRGGLDARRRFAERCGESVFVQSSRPKDYPGWDDVVIWFDKSIGSEVSRPEMEKALAKRSKSFLNVAIQNLT